MVKEKEIIFLNELFKLVYNYKKKILFKIRFIKFLFFFCISEVLIIFFFFGYVYIIFKNVIKINKCYR